MASASKHGVAGDLDKFASTRSKHRRAMVAHGAKAQENGNRSRGISRRCIPNFQLGGGLQTVDKGVAGAAEAQAWTKFGSDGGALRKRMATDGAT